MDFNPSPLARQMCDRLNAFIDRYVLPYNAAWHAAVQAGDYPPPFLEDLKALAREEGLWNLFLPTLRDDEPGTRLSNLDYAPLAEAMGRLPWAAEVFNCSAPDTGNIELLHRFASPAQRAQWLQPLLHGQCRSAFAMSEPDVASSDPTNLQTTVRRRARARALRATPWCSMAASGSSPARRTPQCQLLIVLCRNADADESADPDSHHRHSMVLVPVGTPGVEVVRNIHVLHHHAPEGHCEIRLHNVRVPATALLGDWGRALPWRRRAWGRGGCTTACAPLASASWPCNWRQNARWSATPLASRCLNKPMCRSGWPTRASRSTRRAGWCCTPPGCWTRGTPPSPGRCAAQVAADQRGGRAAAAARW